VLRTIDTVKVFDIIWVMTRGGPFSSTKSMSMLVYEHTFSNLKAGSGSAIAFIVTLICLVFILAYVRLLRRQSA
jgi:multiple sugar transport system permease protein